LLEGDFSRFLCVGERELSHMSVPFIHPT
jgi:hypothetical protein